MGKEGLRDDRGLREVCKWIKSCCKRYNETKQVDQDEANQVARIVCKIMGTDWHKYSCVE